MPDSGFYTRSQTVTTSDTVNLDGTTFSASASTKAIPCDAIFVGVGGTVTVRYESGMTDQFTCATGTILPVRAIGIKATGTAATTMNALYTDR